VSTRHLFAREQNVFAVALRRSVSEFSASFIADERDIRAFTSPQADSGISHVRTQGRMIPVVRRGKPRHTIVRV
jgi:hypothetical protein